jgi:hypothetical protein
MFATLVKRANTCILQTVVTYSIVPWLFVVMIAYVAIVYVKEI